MDTKTHKCEAVVWLTCTKQARVTRGKGDGD